MLDGVSLDQLRTFVAAVDEGSFSAAGRRLNRAQSVVSQSLANLESQLDLKLFDRGARKPVLTDQGRALVEQARAIIIDVGLFKSRAKGLAGGLEAELSVVVDVMFPIDSLTNAIGSFRTAFPDTALRLHVEALGAVIEPILAGHCAFGIMGSLPVAPDRLVTEPVSQVLMVMVSSPLHPLAGHRGAISAAALSEHVQLVLSDRSTLSNGREFGVYSPRTWRLADLGAKHAFLRAGLGWGSMPFELVEPDIASGKLVRLIIEDANPKGYSMRMSAVYRADSLPGPAGRWLIEKLKDAHDSRLVTKSAQS